MDTYWPFDMINWAYIVYNNLYLNIFLFLYQDLHTAAGSGNVDIVKYHLEVNKSGINSIISKGVSI